jgi:methylated-DNA-[protein]-cysteine S-methyltransferase
MSARKDKHDEDIERWLDGRVAPGRSPRYAEAMDAAFAAGPEPRAWAEARQHLEDRMNAAAPRVYYDRLAPTPVGPLWVAVTDHGLAGVAYGGSEGGFVEATRRRLRARLERSPARTAAVRRELVEYLEGRRTTFTVSVDLRHVTPFQKRVLEAARAVPCGHIATYGEIGRAIGRPQAARAVGQALGSNPVPIVVPCHRVLASDGSLGGYSGRGGIRTKRQLLALEGALLA